MRLAPALLVLAFAASASHAQPTAQVAERSALQPEIHMYEATRADPALAREFTRVIAPVVGAAPWMSKYGTTSPSAIEELDGRTYHVFHGCKPHDCVTESYTILYDASAKRITAGAFVRNQYDGAVITESHITWLGQPEFDAAGVLAKYLY